MKCQDNWQNIPAITWREKWYLMNLSIWLRKVLGRMFKVLTDFY